MTYKRAAKRGKRSQEFDSDRFVDAEAAALYTEKFSTLTPLVEREVSLEDFSHISLPQLFLTRKWEPLLVNLASPSAQLVREFYSNIHDISDSKHFSVFLRGHHFRVTPDFLSQMLSFPRVENPLYPYSATTCPLLNILTSFLANRPLPFDGKGFSAVSFTSEVMLISRIIGTNILPAQKLSALSLDRAKFLYAFMHNDSIDLGSVMCAHIVKSFNSRKAGLYLPYACAIQKLLLMLEIPYPSSFPRMDTPAKIGLNTLTQIISHKKKAQSASSSTIPAHVPSYMTDNKYMMESMKLLLERTSSMMSEISLLKADSQLTRTEVLHMQGTQEKLVEAMARLIHDNDLLTAATSVLQAESSKNRADIQWIRQYLGQMEAAAAAAPTLAPTNPSTNPSSAFPSSSQPHPSDTEYFSSDGDNHDDLSDME
ncbi:hypothetical protein CJ030_MR5G003416 [Morella rubra]|uniref:Putative plant transposon protein domain-containing protein n=1 Tax=Morella rubra TaxID=262757 RepID=A0A6A1VL78_9ROSI|nr:hypothetical protein CJ030_MR5G003416 [Morella rubra]